MASTVRYCMTVGGSVVLVVGTLCFASWSKGNVAVQPGSLPTTVKQPSPEMPPTWLKSVIILCCSVGGLLLFFGLLWSIQERTKKLSQGDFYRLSRDLYRLAVECPVKEPYRPPKEAVIPTYEETMHYPLAEGLLQFPVQPEEDLQCHAPGDALLGSASFSRPPSYESILLAQGPVSGLSAAGSSPV